MKYYLLAVIALLSLSAYEQEEGFKSIIREDQEFYDKLNIISRSGFDSLNDFRMMNLKQPEVKTLVRRVFGYHPYWAGSNYLNYQWDLLTDLCFFSYEVDPATGDPITIHDWYTSEAVDSALANGVNVHLCVTMFSGHATFFGSATSRQTLISNVIGLILNRGAQGVNVDFEAVPLSQSVQMTEFLTDLANQVHAALPGSMISIASPAVNWNNTFNVSALSEVLDFFMVMGYDYYWNGSSQAGPVSPLFTLTDSYDYNFTKTVSYYQSQGVPTYKIIMGVPYYARQWQTEGQYAPSNTVGAGTAYTYRFVKDNASGYYSAGNQHIEPNSRSTYYSFNTGSWNQCFLDEPYSMAKKYDLINRRNLAGIGIWALGYDNGYMEMWDLIGQKFTEIQELSDSDTIYDSGGPAFNYYNNESYLYTVSVVNPKIIHLIFDFLDIEDGYDSLWIFDGADTSGTPAGYYSGNTTPAEFFASTNIVTLKFSSDNGITGQGWQAIYEAYPPSGSTEKAEATASVCVYPNPAENWIHVKPINFRGMIEITVISSLGRRVSSMEQSFNYPGSGDKSLNISGLPKGIFYLRVKAGKMVTVHKIVHL
jgi:hypothetical protein